MNIIIEVSAKHCHLSQSDLDKLFGIGYQLKVLRNLSQPTEFATEEKVILKKDKKEISLRIVGPVRNQTQIELSISEAKVLGFTPPLRISGDIDDSLGGLLIGPYGQVKLNQGIIMAKRHLHCDLISADQLKLSNNQIIKIKVKGSDYIFNNVVVRISEQAKLALHIDIDEAKQANILPGDVGIIV